MGALLNTPSSGQSEVLETLHYQGAIASGIPLFRVGPLVSHRWGGREDREQSDSAFEADILTVVAALSDAGFVEGHADADGASVDLTSDPPATTRVVLTGTGRREAQHPRPRPRDIRRYA